MKFDDLSARALASSGMKSSFLIPASLVLPLACLLVFAPVVISDEYTWDFAFLLSGAWHLYWGHLPFVDFDSFVGLLVFLPTAVSMAVFGAGPESFIIGQAAVSMAVLILASYVCWKRASSVTAAVFVTWISTLVILPSALGDGLFDFSHAMSYNRYGWALISTLALHLFLPGREDTKYSFSTMDQAVTFLLVFSLFHIKITYFLVALGLLVVWCAVEFRQAKKAHALWILMGVFVVSIPLIPWHSGHVLWVWKALGHGSARTGAEVFLTRLFSNVEVLSLAGAYVLLIWLPASDRVRALLQTGLFSVICLSGFLLLSQNWDFKFIPLVAAAFLIQFERMRQDSSVGLNFQMKSRSEPSAPINNAGKGVRAPLLLGAAAISLAYPVAMLAYDAGQILLYLVKAYTSSRSLLVLDSDGGGQLSRLAVPRDSSNVFEDVKRITNPGQLILSERHRTPKRRDNASQQEYILLVKDGIAALRPVVQREDRVLALAGTNPFPLALGLEPVKHEAIWSTDEYPPPDWKAAIENATLVMEPKWGRRPPLVDLPDKFSLVRETDLWKIYKIRTPAGYVEELQRSRFEDAR